MFREPRHRTNVVGNAEGHFDSFVSVHSSLNGNDRINCAESYFPQITQQPVAQFKFFKGLLQNI